MMDDEGNGNGKMDDNNDREKKSSRLTLNTKVKRVGGQREDGRVAASEQASKVEVRFREPIGCLLEADG